MESLSIDQEGQGVERTSDRTQDTHNHARRTHLTHHSYNKTSVKWRSKKTESILILLMTLVGNFNGDVELYNWTGESDHIYWENSYNCFKDESLPMSLGFFFLLKDNYAKVFFHFILCYIQRLHWSKNDLWLFLFFEKLLSVTKSRSCRKSSHRFWFLKILLNSQYPKPKGYFILM